MSLEVLLFTPRLRALAEGVVATLDMEVEAEPLIVPKEEADDNQRLNTLCTLAVDPLRGCVYICEQSNNRIRSIELSDLSR